MFIHFAQTGGRDLGAKDCRLAVKLDDLRPVLSSRRPQFVFFARPLALDAAMAR